MMIARPLTNPSITGCGTIRTSLPSRSKPERHHDQAAEQHRRQQILHAVLHHQRDDDHRHRTRRAGDHARPPAEQRRQRTNDEGAVQAHQRIEVRHQRERNALGQQGKRGGESGQDIGAQTDRFHGLPD
jgi:hypothetical protein